MADIPLLSNNKIKSIVSMSAPQQETNKDNALLDPSELAGVTPDAPIERNAEVGSIPVGTPPIEQNRRIQSIVNFQPREEEAPPLIDVDSQDPSFLDKLGYFFDSAENDVTNAAIYLEAKWPLGRIAFEDGGFRYISPDEAYGEGFSEADEVTRGEMIKAFKQRTLDDKYPEFAYMPPDAPVLEFIGSAGKILASPSTLFPVGQSYKAMAGIGALLGAEYEVLEQLAENREVSDIQSVVVSSGVGAASAVGLGFAANKLANQVRKISKAREDSAIVAQANKDADLIYDEVVKIVALEEVPPSQLLQEAGKRIGLTLTEARDALKISSRPIMVPKNAADAQKILEASRSTPLGTPLGISNLGIMSSEIGRYSKSLANKIVRSQGRIQRKSFAVKRTLEPYLKAINKQLPRAFRGELNDNLLSGNIDAAKKILDEHTEIGGNAITQIQTVLDKIYGDVRMAGISIPYKDGYIPRNVIDRNGLRAFYGSDSVAVKAIDNRLKALARRLGKQPDQLTSAEQAIVYNDIALRPGKIAGKGKAGFTQARLIKEINEGNRKFYDDFESSIYDYVDRAYTQVETANLFGAMAKKKPNTYLYDIEESLGELIGREVTLGNIHKEDVHEVTRLVRKAIEPPSSPAEWIDIAQSAGYAQTIASYLSTLMQFGDLPHLVRRNGLFPTAQALINPFNKKNVKVEEILGDVIRAEMGTTKGVARGMRVFVEKLLASPLTGFSQLDKFMKTSYLKGALTRASKQIQTEKGFNRIREDYSAVFKEDFLDLVQDLRQGKLTDNVKDYLFLDASDIYPTSHLEQIKAVVKEPNWRILTMLKSYTLKSVYDGLIRRDIIGNAKKGRYEEAAKNFLYLSFVLGMSEATLMEAKDFMLGRGFEVGDIPANFSDGLLRTLGASRYVLDRYLKQGDVAGGIVETIMPPGMILKSAYEDGAKALDQELGLENSSVIASLPIIGRFYLNYIKKDAHGRTQREREIKSQESERRERAAEQRSRQVLGNRQFSY